MTTLPRGIRNNNPGNIRLGQSWQGLTESQTDGSFCQFTTPEYGIRAIMKIMETYVSHGFNTITKIITRWAPPNENNTPAYIYAVALSADIKPDVVLEIADDATWTKIIRAIILHENGQNPYSDATIDAGIKLAL